jgi:prepilin-type N-terminal cleavage/methylation domain-containing protein
MGINKGFTLIELVVIILIVGILAISVLVSGTAKGPVRLEAACQRLAADLRYIQQMAMAQQVRFGISFDTSDESYFGYRVNTSNKAKSPHTQSDLEVEFDEMKEFNEIQITSTNFSDRVEFDSIGAPYDGSSAPLSSEGVATLTDGTNSRTVRIEAVTGKVSIQ